MLPTGLKEDDQAALGRQPLQREKLASVISIVGVVLPETGMLVQPFSSRAMWKAYDE
jgi:hypothetical protein